MKTTFFRDLDYNYRVVKNIIERKMQERIYDFMSRPDISGITFGLIKNHLGRVEAPEYAGVKKITEFPLGEDPKQVQIFKEKAYVTSMKGPGLEVFDIKSERPERQLNLPGMPVEVLIDGERNLCLVSEMGKGQDGINSVFGIDLDNFEISFRIATGGDWSKFMALRPGTNELWVSNWKSDNISILDLETKKLVNIIPVGKTPRGIAFTPEGGFVYVCGYYSRDLLKYDTRTKIQVKRITMPFVSYHGAPRHFVIDHNGKYGYLSNQGRGAVHKVDLETDKIIKTTFSGKYTSTIDLSTNDEMLFCANEREDFASVIDTRNLTVIGKIPTKGKAFGLDVSPDSKYLGIASFKERLLEVFLIK